MLFGQSHLQEVYLSQEETPTYYHWQSKSEIRFFSDFVNDNYGLSVAPWQWWLSSYWATELNQIKNIPKHPDIETANRG